MSTFRFSNPGKNPNKEDKPGEYPTESAKKSDISAELKKRPFKFRKCVNNPKWYYKDEKALNMATELNWDAQQGLPREEYDLPAKTQMLKPYVPNVLCLEVVPVLQAQDENDPVNYIAVQIWNDMQATLSYEIKSFDSADISSYLFETSSALSIISWGERAYHLVTKFSEQNLNMPRKLFEALGADFNDFSHHIADLEYDIYWAQQQLAVVAMPADASIYYRKDFINGLVYTDNARTAKSPLYLINEQTFVKKTLPTTEGDYDEYVNLAQRASLSGGTLITYDVYKTALYEIVNALVGNSDVKMISSYFRRYYDKKKRADAFIKLTPVTTADVYEVVEDHYLLSQIKHARIHSPAFTGFIGAGHILSQAAGVTTGSPYVVFKPFSQVIEVTPGTSHGLIPNFITTNELKPHAEYVVEATRLMTSVSIIDAESGATSPKYKITSCGSEVAIGLKCQTSTGNVSTISCVSTTNFNLNAVSVSRAFDYFPLIAVKGSSNTTVTVAETAFDWNNSIPMPSASLSKLNRCAAFGLYALAAYKDQARVTMPNPSVDGSSEG